MVGPLAVLAEPDDRLRELMRRPISEAGFEILQASSAPQLDAVLRLRALRSPEIVLLVLAARLAAPCTPAIAEVARERLRASFSLAHVVWTCEFGTLSSFTPPVVEPCRVHLILEKPFELHALHAVALGCLGQGPLRSGAQQ